MNNTTAYEIKIAEKLEQLPVPDMADSIWASIQLQLDADLPGEDAGNSPSTNPTKGLPGMGKVIYFTIFSAIIIALIFIYKTNKNNQRKKDNPPVPDKTEINIPTIESSPALDIPTEKNNISVSKPIIKKDSVAASPIPKKLSNFDVLTPQVAPLSKIDSVSTLNNVTAPPIFTVPTLPTVDATPIVPVVKPKGVKGITNDDYKIQNVKKDTLKKGG